MLIIYKPYPLNKNIKDKTDFIFEALGSFSLLLSAVNKSINSYLYIILDPLIETTKYINIKVFIVETKALIENPVFTMFSASINLKKTNINPLEKKSS